MRSEDLVQVFFFSLERQIKQGKLGLTMDIAINSVP